jgi:hypothetical protein
VKRRQDKLVGIEGGRLLRRAAIEMDVLGKRNARIAEVDGRAHTYAPGKHEVWYIERRHASGMWEAEGIEDIADQGMLRVQRSLKENLLPALTMQLIGKLVRGGVFNDFASAKAHVLDDCEFLRADKVTA